MKWWKTILDGFKLLLKTYLPTLLIFASLAIMFSLISTFAMMEFNWSVTLENEQVKQYVYLYGEDLSLWPLSAQEFYSSFRKHATWNNVINLFINYIPLTLSGVLSSYYMIERAKGTSLTIFDSIKHVLRGERIRITLLITLILSILVAAGFAFFFIFGIIMLIMVGLCVPTLVDSTLDTRDVLNEGFKLGKEYRIRTTILVIIGVAFFSFFGDFLARIFFPSIPNSIRIGWLDPATRNWGTLIYVNLMNFLTTAAFQPILFAFITAHYMELTVQKEVAWFDAIPLTKKRALEIEDKDIFPNGAVFALFLVISLVISIIGIIDLINARIAGG